MRFITALIMFSLMTSNTYASYTIVEGKLVNSSHAPVGTVQEHYSRALEAYQKEQWSALNNEAKIIKYNFPDTPFAQEAVYFMAVAAYRQGELEDAAKNFSLYLSSSTAPRYFEETIQFKFLIANEFREGAKKHLFGWQALPKWASAKDEAIGLYDEVINALPGHELAAQALYGKAETYKDCQEYKSSIEAYQNLIRRFPKHHLAPVAYVGISHAYLKQCNPKAPDVNLLDLLEINLNRFQAEYPLDQRISEAQKHLLTGKEIYANHLYETGRFYERTKKKSAAIIYYAKVIAEYGETESAKKSESRLEALGLDKDQVLSNRGR